MIHDGSHKFELHSFNEKQADGFQVQTAISAQFPVIQLSSNISTSLYKIRPQPQKQEHTFEEAVEWRFQRAFFARAELFRKLQNLSQLLSLHTVKPGNCDNPLSLTETRRKHVNERTIHSREFCVYFPLKQAATSIVEGLEEVVVIGLANNI